MMNRASFGLLTLLVATGCASTSMHTPEAVPVTEKMGLREFQAHNSLSLVNGASEPDRRRWTESVMTFAAEQLEQRGAQVIEDSPHRLSLELVKARRITAQLVLAPFLMPEGCEVVVRIETGEEYVEEYTATAGAYTWQAACNQGITSAVVSILNDPTVRRYLELSDSGAAGAD